MIIDQCGGIAGTVPKVCSRSFSLHAKTHSDHLFSPPPAGAEGSGGRGIRSTGRKRGSEADRFP